LSAAKSRIALLAGVRRGRATSVRRFHVVQTATDVDNARSRGLDGEGVVNAKVVPQLGNLERVQLMIRKVLMVIAASRSELIALVGAIVAISLAVWKTLENSDIGRNCFPSSGKCLDTIVDSPTGFKVVFGIVFICGIVLLILNYLKLRESWRKASIEPIGFFYDQVSEPGKPDNIIEHSLVQVRRTANGGLEYRGVGRRLQSAAALE
jgi:hypothetical protein